MREAEASSSLVDQGIDVLTGHTGSPRVIVQMAERRGVFGCGYQFDQSSMAPHGFLTGAQWAWGTVYVRIAQMVRDGKSVTNGTIPRRLTGTLKDEFCKLSPYGPSVTAQTRDRIAAAKAAILNGSLEIYRGPIRDNNGQNSDSRGQDAEDRRRGTRPDGLAGGRRGRKGVGMRRYEGVLVPLGAIVAGMFVFGLFCAAVGVNPLGVYASIWKAGFGSWYSWQNTLVRASPLLL